VSPQKTKIEKIFFSIGEVADMLSVTPSSIRYWESQFEELEPGKSTKGTRQFTESDIETLKLIHFLVKDKGMTIKGAKNKLKYSRQETIHSLELIRRLQEVRDELIQIRNEMNG
jgi:DNA-binding transcriptional MerR regulator